jgi:hypothetical protein
MGVLEVVGLLRVLGYRALCEEDEDAVLIRPVYNHGTEDRPTAKKLPGSATTLGWVRFQ